MSVRLVLYAKKYEVDGNTGINVHYVDPAYVEHVDAAHGMPVMKITSYDLEMVYKLKSAPGLFELDFQDRPGAGGKSTNQLVGASLIKPVDLHTLLPENSKK